MAEIIGKNIELGLALESTRGTAVTTAGKWVKNVSADIIARAEKVVEDSSRNTLSDSLNSRLIKKWFDGDLTGIAQADLLGYFFKNIYGSVNSVIVSGAVKDHTFSLLENIEHPTLSIHAKDGGNSQEVFNGGVVNTLELTASVDDYVRYTANLIARDATANASSPSYTTEYDWVGKDITIKIADTSAGLAGASALSVKELSITWDTGAMVDYGFGSDKPVDIYTTKLSIEGSFTKNYEDDTFKDLFTADTTKYMSITIAGDAVLAGSNRPTLTLTLNKVQIQDWNRSGANDELVTEEVSFKAFYNETDSKSSTPVLRNITASY